MKFSKGIVMAVVGLNAVATIAFLWAFVSTGGNEPTTLIAAWFGFTTGELWLLAGIRKTKAKQAKEGDNDEAS